ncbi:hypothetical protein BH11PSE4_BH11PSE4_15890 [soil metagenome]
MIDPELRDLWTPTGLLLGFQVTFFKWRLEREVGIADKDVVSWLAPSDYLSILGMLCFVVGVILLPVAGVAATPFARTSFGLGALIFIGQSFGLAAHYELYDLEKRTFAWFPTQEKVAVTLTISAAVLYLVVMLK